MKPVRPAVVFALGLISAAIAYTCSGPVEAPTWDVTKSGYDPYGSGAILSPANDTRANLLLLLADRHALRMTAADAEPSKLPLVMMPWRVMAAQAVTAGDAVGVESDIGTRCQTRSSGAAAFKAAVARSRASVNEQAALSAARDAMTTDCDTGEVTVAAVAATTPAGRTYADYLTAAADFYAGRFDQARTKFEALSTGDDAWLRDTARYMVGRTLLNKAINASLNEYGDLAEPAKRDVTSARSAGVALAAYGKAQPNGIYAASASGLIRRAHWLAGDGDALAADLDSKLRRVHDAADATELIDEVDTKLATDHPAVRPDGALLLAVQDLQRMRGVSASDYWVEEHILLAKIGKPELDAQAATFRGEPALFGYLQAAHAYWVRKDPRAVLALIPDAAHQARFSYLEFSRQMLRGMALDAVKDRNARGFWLSLLPGATQPYQNGAVQLALAGHDEASGNEGAVFVAGSPVTHVVMRDLLLEFTAGPGLLRQQVTRGQSDHERKVAQYILLAKELQRGLYRDFVADSAVIPASASDGDYAWAAFDYTTTYNDQLGDPPLDSFRSKPAAETGCQPIRDVALALAGDPASPRLTLCLAEFLRTQDFDNFAFDVAPEWSGLGRGPSQFPGRPYIRMASYKAVLANPRSSADDKAFALNRMVRCYAPAKSSSCGGAEEEPVVRKGWYDRLKRDYPASPWARDLHYYW
ncbi:MAG: hypothetical protein ABIR87_01220 [Sphingomicrobium sp.]